MEHNLDLRIKITAEDTFSVYVDEPETGFGKLLKFQFSPDEHPVFNEQIGNEIYSWISIWLDGEKSEDGFETIDGELFDGLSYVSKWCLTDFYPDCEKELKEAFESGKNFDTGWFGCRKEINYARYTKDDNGVIVQVSAEMDDLYDGDLIYDAIVSESLDGHEYPDDIYEEVKELALMMQIEDRTDEFAVLPRDVTFEEVIKYTDTMEEKAENNNDEMFLRLRQIVREYIEKYEKEAK